MSQENVDAVKASYEAFNRRDFDALLAFYHPEIVWEQDERFVEPGTHYGHHGVRHVIDSIFESFAEFRLEAHEVLDLDDRVLAIVRVVGKAKLTGLELETPGAHLFWISGGKATKVKLFVDPAEARAEAGVSERARAD
jgi:ketosteroid isomerase-like protein